MKIKNKKETIYIYLYIYLYDQNVLLVLCLSLFYNIYYNILAVNNNQKKGGASNWLHHLIVNSRDISWRAITFLTTKQHLQWEEHPENGLFHQQISSNWKKKCKKINPTMLWTCYKYIHTRTIKKFTNRDIFTYHPHSITTPPHF